MVALGRPLPDLGEITQPGQGGLKGKPVSAQHAFGDFLQHQMPCFEGGSLRGGLVIRRYAAFLQNAEMVNPNSQGFTLGWYALPLLGHSESVPGFHPSLVCGCALGA